MASIIKILKVRIDNFDESRINNWILNVLSGEAEKKFVCTLNPEIVLKGYRDSSFREIINSSDMNLCDGIGLKFGAWIDGRRIRARYTGVSLVENCLAAAAEMGLKVLIVMSKNSLSRPEEIESAIFKKTRILAKAIYFSSDDIFDSSPVKNAQIVFVNFGSPDQEKFIFENREKFESTKLIVGVGGAFDFLTGKIRRAPMILQKIGMEWFWRVLMEPKRVLRIWRAVVIFPLSCLQAKVSGGQRDRL